MIRYALHSLAQYVRAPAARSADDLGDEIEQEIAFHVSECARDLMERGMPEADAKRAALERFGDPARIAAECHADAVCGLAVWHRCHLAVTAALTVAIVALSLGIGSPSEGPISLSERLPTAIASMIDNDWTGDVQGRILDERGRPIDGAHVLIVVKTWPDSSYFQRAYTAITGADGRFIVEDVHPVNERYEVQIAALAEQRVLQSNYLSRERGVLAPVVFMLPPSGGLALRIMANGGEPLSGIEVLPHSRVDADGTTHLIYFDSAQSVVRRVDEHGHVELPYFRPGETATLMLRTPRGEWESRDVVVPAIGQVATIPPPSDSAPKQGNS